MHYAISFKLLTLVLGDGEKQPVAIKIDNCNDEYCKLTRDVVSKMEFTFKTVSEATALTAKIRAQIKKVWVPWPLGKLSKVCDNLSDKKCPLPANTQATFTFSMKVPTIAPVGTKAIVEYKIIDQEREIVACTRFPILIV